MIRDYDKVIDGLKALSEAPQTTRGQAELLKGAVLAIMAKLAFFSKSAPMAPPSGLTGNYIFLLVILYILRQ